MHFDTYSAAHAWMTDVATKGGHALALGAPSPASHRHGPYYRSAGRLSEWFLPDGQDGPRIHVTYDRDE